MKTTPAGLARTLAPLAGAIALQLAAPSPAAELSVQPRLGLSVVDIDPDVPGVDADSDGDVAFGLTLGYGLSATWSAELEWVSGGGETTLGGSGGSRTSDFDVTSLAAYAAYRSAGPIYFTARVGVRTSDLSSDGDVLEESSDTGASFGGGLGYRLGERLAVEADYTLIGSDVSWLMLSARYAFGL